MVPFIVGTEGVQTWGTRKTGQTRPPKPQRGLRGRWQHTKLHLMLDQISAMPVLIEYEAKWLEYRHLMRGDEHMFDYSFRKGDEYDHASFALERESSFLNASAILDDFQDTKTPFEALDFLNKTGRFSMFEIRMRWTYFKRWRSFCVSRRRA